MNKSETSKIIAVLMASYPNFLSNKTTTDIQATISIWDEMLKDYSYQEVSVAIKVCITQDKSNFAPSIGQVINKIIGFRNQGTELTEQEAWNLVSKATKNSAYHATGRNMKRSYQNPLKHCYTFTIKGMVTNGRR